MKLHVASRQEFPTQLDIPWGRPLAEWDLPFMIRISQGICRNVVRFVAHRDTVYAVKEISEPLAVREYELLRSLEDLGMPVVQAVCLVTERGDVEGASARVVDRGLLITRYLDRSLPLRSLITSSASGDQANNLMDSVAELLVRLHLAGFFWGDCSLSNTLFRLDAGLYAGYLVDAETGELHPSLSDGQRRHDLRIASENLAGELLDLEAGFGLPQGVDPLTFAESLEPRYLALWDEITRDEIYPASEQFRIDARIRRLNELGYNVDELEIETLDDGDSIRVHADVVEPGYHRRLVHSLTGLDVQENQARRLLNDMYSYRAWRSGHLQEEVPEAVSGFRWFAEVYQPTLALVPEAFRSRLEDAELFHQILEHRWYMSEREGREIGLPEVVPAYVEEVLMKLPEPAVQASPLTSSAGGVPPGRTKR